MRRSTLLIVDDESYAIQIQGPGQIHYATSGTRQALAAGDRLDAAQQDDRGIVELYSTNPFRRSQRRVQLGDSRTRRDEVSRKSPLKNTSMLTQDPLHGIAGQLAPR